MHSRKIFTAVLTVVLVMIVSLPANAQRKMRKILFVQDKQQLNQSDLVDELTTKRTAEYSAVPNLVYIKNGGSFSIKLESTFASWEYAMPGVYVQNNIIENITVNDSQDLWFKTSTGQEISLSTYVHSYVVPSVDGKEIEGQTNLPAGIEYVKTTEAAENFYTWRIRSEADLQKVFSIKFHGMSPNVFLFNAFPTQNDPVLTGNNVKKLLLDPDVKVPEFQLTGAKLLEFSQSDYKNNIKNPKNFVVAFSGKSEGSGNDIDAPYVNGGLKLARYYITWINIIDERPAPIQKHSVTVSAREGGSATGAGTYPAGTRVTVRATANEGYEFEGWHEGETKV